MAVAGHSLEEKDINEILTEIVRIGKEPGKLQLFGLALGLQVTDLSQSVLNSQCHGDPLVYVISQWLKKANPDPTWEKLVEALNTQTVDESVLARSVARNHGINIEQVQRSLSDSATTPRDVSPLLVKQRSDPLPPPQEVTANPFQPTNNNNPHQNSGSVAVSVKQADCMDASVQKPRHHSEASNSESEEFSFRCLEMEGLSENEKKNLRGRLKKEYEKINEKFGQLNVNIRSSLIERNIKPRELAHLLMELSAFPVRARSQHKPLLEDRFDELNEKEDIGGIFVILRDYTSFFSYHIIAFIVQNLGTDQDKEEFETYRLEVVDYCKRTIFECPTYSTPRPKFADLIMKVDKTIKKSHTIESMEYFQASVAEILEISEHTLRLCSVEEGCLKLRYQLPWFIQSLLFPLSSEQEEMLKSKGVKGLMCGGYRFGQQEQIHQKMSAQSHTSAVQPTFDSQKAQYRTERSPRAHFYKSEMLPHSQKKPTQHYHGRKTGQQVHKEVCFKYFLTGNCRFRDRCDFRHAEPLANPSVGYVPLPLGARSPIERKGRSYDGKAYIVVESDRNPREEVKIVAEDDAAVDHARERIMSRKKPIPQEGIHRRGQRKDCVPFKLMGECTYENCGFKHDPSARVSRPAIGYVSHPVGKLPNVKMATRKIGYDRETGKCYTSVLSERDPEKEVKIYAEDDRTLQYAKDQITVSLSKAHNIYIIRCYLNPVGVETPNLCLHFSQDELDERRHVLLPSPPVRGSMVKQVRVENFEELSFEPYPQSTYSLLSNPDQTVNQEFFMKANAQLRITREYRKQIQKQIYDALVWMHENHHRPKLEGRFGKISWSMVRGDMADMESITVNRLVRWMFKNSTYRRMFRTRVSVDGSRALQKLSLTDTGSTLETYDFKLSVRNVGELDIKLKFPHGKLLVITTKINEHKPVLFDVLCLHRQHDIRMCLSYHNTLPPDDPTVQKVIAMINVPKPGTLTFKPKGTDGDWTVKMIRHKKRRAFFFEGFSHKYVVTITSVWTYEITREDVGKEQLTLEPSDYTEHLEIELHNLQWECSFGCGRDPSPEESVAHILEAKAIPAEIRDSVPEPWTPDKIIKDFEMDNFIQMLENVNDQMELY